MTTEQDKRAILARRALLVSTALTSFSCAPPGPTGTAETVTLPEKSAEREPNGPIASASASVAPLPPLTPWEERVAKAPARFRSSTVPEKSKEQLGWRWGQIDTALAAVKDLWLGEPELCDGSRAECREAWRKLGAKLKIAQDAARGMRPGLCGSPITPSSLERHLDRHVAFVTETLQLALTHWTERAAAQGVLADQEWQKQIANASLVPPMPCLSCMAPDRSTLTEGVSFPQGSATLSASERQVLEGALKTTDPKWYFEVWGHASSTESAPVELAAQRARAVEAELVKRGVDKRRILIVSAGAELAARPLVEIAIITR